MFTKIAAKLNGKNSRPAAIAGGVILLLFVAAWAITVAGNASHVPSTVGFDADGHLDYINYLLEKGRIPLANEGWQMYQPPLYYWISAAAANAAKSVFNQQYFTSGLKLIPFLCGLGMIFVCFYAAKTVFPDDKPKQVLAAVFAAIVPMNIYISHYISNESLCGFMMALSVLCTLRLLQSDGKPLKNCFILGVVLGVSLLTKYTAFILLPVIAVVLLYEFAVKRRYGFSKILICFAAAIVPMLLIGGWFYLRNWNHFGKIIVANWDPDVLVKWWQDPGYHTYKNFLQFGKVFVYPYFAGFYSFFDSLYSTFWADGQIGGTAEYIYAPPWNYEYMSALYILAIPATILIMAGLIRACIKIFRACSSSWLFILGSIFIIHWSLLLLELKLARYGQTKAFYGLFMIVPVSILFVYGFSLVDDFFRIRFRIGRILLFGYLGALAIAVFISFHCAGPKRLRIQGL